MGCQDLLEDVPGRSRRDKDSVSSPTGDLKSFVKGVTSKSSGVWRKIPKFSILLSSSRSQLIKKL